MARTRKIKPQVQYFPKRLMDRLDYIRHYPLTLLEAPSGFGKTTALRHFFEIQIPKDVPVFWHTFSSVRPQECWKSFCELIGQVDRQSQQRLFNTGAPNEDTLPEIRKIFAEMTCGRETYLVLDDLSFWQQLPYGAFLQALSHHGGAELHVVAATQVLPQEEHYLIAQSNRFRLLQEDILSFQKEDINAYYRRAGILLNPLQLDEVAAITEGWVMALYLQMLSFSETGRFEKGGMEGLLQNTLWRSLPQKEREFLLAISIFSRFSLEQATAVSGIGSVQTEKLLCDKRVFIRMDKETLQYSLHNLFRAFLTEEFTLLPEEQKRKIYLAGGRLAEQAGARADTLRFYYLSGEWENILCLPLTSYEIADIADETTRPMILDILENTPFDRKKQYPKAIVPLAFTLFFLHENQKLRAMQREIIEIIDYSDITQNEKNALLGEMELLLSFLEYNRIDAMSARHRRALFLLNGPATLISVKSTWTFGSPSVLYMFYRESGRLNEELEQMDSCMPIYYVLTGYHGCGAENVMRAEAHLMRAELDEAEILGHKALLVADEKKQNSIYQCGLFLLARVALLRGNKKMLKECRRAIQRRSRQNTEDLFRYTQDLAEGYLHLLLGEPDELANWLAQGDINDKRLVIMTQPFAYILYEWLLLERKEYLKLIGVCQYGMGISSIFPNLLPQIYTDIFLSCAFSATEKREEALQALSRALSRALPDRLYLPFAEHYEGICDLLSAAQGGSQEDRKKIKQIAAELNGARNTLCVAAPSFAPREKEVVEMVKRGLSNKQIAAELYVSVSTVKTLLGRIYEKTGVSSKTQLVMLDQ